jgi:branched-subunit amino acid permease
VESLTQFGRGAWLVISVAWLTGAFGSAALLALFFKRLHPQLSFHKLWAVWVIVVSLLAGAVFALGLV